MKHKTFSFRSSQSNSNGLHELTLEGDLGIRNAVAIRKSLDSVEFNGSSVSMKLRNVEKMDVTSIQNILAFRKTLGKKERSLNISANVTAEIQNLLKNTGLNRLFNIS